MISIIPAHKANELATMFNKEITQLYDTIDEEIKKASKNGMYFVDINCDRENYKVIKSELEKLGYAVTFEVDRGMSYIHIAWYCGHDML